MGDRPYHEGGERRVYIHVGEPVLEQRAGASQAIPDALEAFLRRRRRRRYPRPVPDQPPQPLPPPTPTPLPDTEKQQVLNLHNQFRTENGASILTRNTMLDAAAQRHAQDMLNSDYFSHTGKDGSSPGDRIRVVGYLWSTYGENIAWGSGSYAGPERIVDGWKNSEGHRRNMLNRSFKDIGIGIAKANQGQTFQGRAGAAVYVCVFGTQR